MKRKLLPILIVLAAALAIVFVQLPTVSDAAGTSVYTVDAAVSSAEVVTAWNTGSYDYVCLTTNLELALDGEEIVIDLAGYSLTVSGNGKLYAFDSANDTYDHTLCGVVTNNGTVACEQSFVAPNGNRYIALTEGNFTTVHRVEMEITTVTLRLASAGLYYKASYTCDRYIESLVDSYGIAVSLENVPGSDFETATTDAYTIVSDDFVSGTTVTSGSVIGILKEGLSSAQNIYRLNKRLYANAYIDLGNGPIMTDLDNIGKTINDDGFSGIGCSMMGILKTLDGRFDDLSVTVQNQLNAFKSQWDGEGLDWSFTNIKGTTEVDYTEFNADLSFAAGTTDAYCPVCEITVTWTALPESSTMIAAVNGGHYYLASDMVFNGSGSGVYAYMQAPGTTGHTACVHLNGNDLTSTKVPAFHGSNGVLNIMGNGIVTGMQDSSEKGKGAAVQTNNKIVTNAVNLYGGTYRKSDDSHANAGVIGIRAGGGGVFVYGGATIDASSGYAVYIGAPTKVDHRLGLYGCTVNGDVAFLLPADEAYQTRAELKDCTVNGTVTVTEKMTLLLSGKLDIDQITVAEDAVLTTGGLDTGSVIGIDADGAFTLPSGSVSNYTELFVPLDTYKSIVVRDNTLYCDKNYASDLVFTEGTNAVCLVCEKEVTWTVLEGGETPADIEAGGHYYLADDLIYTGTEGAFLTALSGADKVFCVHLNGHDLTAVNGRAFYGSSSTLNIMGSGTVSGRKGSGYGNGSTIQSNTSNVKGTINLYSGTYQQAEDATTSEFTVNLNDAGAINVYRDAVIMGNVSGIAIRLGMATSQNAAVGIYGATVNGDVLVAGADETKGNTTTLTLDDANINGTLDIDGVNTVNVLHATAVELLDMESTTVLILDRLTDGADITVKNAGAFAEHHADAGEYLKYFSTEWIDDQIWNKDGVLTYKINYTGKLQLSSDSTDWCPVCMKTVTWTALTESDTVTVAQDGAHYYLTTDITHTGTTTACLKAPETKGYTACFHLNGHNLTATKIPAIYGSSGVLNVMGKGVVTGYSGSSNRGTALQVNNYLTTVNAVNLYSGTYQKSSDSNTNAYVIGYGSNGGGVYVYEDAVINAGDSLAVYVGVPHASGDNKLGLYNCTVEGDITVEAPSDSRTTKTVLTTQNATVNGTVNIYGSHDITFSGRTKLEKLSLAAGTIVNFQDMLSGSDILVSASGIFTSEMEDADDWLQYFSIDESGDLLIVRDKCFYQGPKQAVPEAETADVEVLEALYAGREVRYGEMHDHTNTGPKADGAYSVAEWKAKMEEIGMDFATIVDHRQSVHMYDDAWDSSMFVGGSEPSAYIKGWSEDNRNLHYNMIFANAADLETLIQAFEGFEYVAAEDGNGGTWVTDVPTFEELQAQAEMVRELGGFFVAVHPKYDNYIVSDDPLDYYFGEYTGIEITTGTGGNMTYKDNEEAYQLWIDLLELGKKVYATAGSDFHKLPNASALTTLYSSERDAQAYVDLYRSGDFVPGWVGIRMAIGDTTMGGTTDFTDQRLVFSVGDMWNTVVDDGYSNGYSYQADHEYCVQLYDDGGLLMESPVNPGDDVMDYFAVDTDPEAKFYRIVVWDLTENTRVAVGNPIWNG